MSSNPGQITLNTKNLHHIHDGRVAMAIDHAIRMVSNDCAARPGEKSKRKVMIEMEAVPVLDSNTARLDNVELKFRVNTSLPKRVSQAYPMLHLGDGALAFQPASPNDPRQSGLFNPDARKDAGEGDSVTVSNEDYDPDEDAEGRGYDDDNDDEAAI